MTPLGRFQVLTVLACVAACTHAEEPLGDQLERTAARRYANLGVWLKPIANEVTLTGKVVDEPLLLVPDRAPAFSFDRFLEADLSSEDADFVFTIELDPPSHARLKRIDPEAPSTVHVEAIAYGRSRSDPSKAIFRGWADDDHPVLVEDSSTGAQPVAMRVTCDGVVDEKNGRCTPAQANGHPLKGQTVTVTGALVRDCATDPCEARREIHPLETLRIHPKE